VSRNKSLAAFVILIVVVTVLGTASIAEAHPHSTIDLMESHSHDPNNENFHEDFVLHTIQEVIISTIEFFKNILFIRV